MLLEAHIKRLHAYVVISIISLIIYYAGIAIKPNDIYAHAIFLLDAYEGKTPLRPHFLYYLSLGAITFFSRNPIIVCAGAILLLTFCTLWKYRLTVYFLSLNFDATPSIHKTSAHVLLAALGMMFCFSLPVSMYNVPTSTTAWLPGFQFAMYVGQFPSNVWHNSTTIFTMPFALLLFFKTVDWLDCNSNESLISQTTLAIAGLCIVNVVSKPNFFLAYFFALPLVVLVLKKSLTWYIAAILIVLSPLPIMGAQYLYFFDGLSNRQIVFSPFGNWNIWANYISISLLASLLFPLVTLFRLRPSSKSAVDCLAWGCLITSYAIYVSFAEVNTLTNRIEMPRNFGWGVTMSTYIVNLVCLRSLMFASIRKTTNGAYWPEWSAFILQVICGLIYLIKFPFFGFY